MRYPIRPRFGFFERIRLLLANIPNWTFGMRNVCRTIAPRRLRVEQLEVRMNLTAEGSPFTLSQTLDTSGLLGTITAQANWGDGTVSNLTVPAQVSGGPLTVRIDYSLDSQNFFNTAEKRQLLQLAADLLVSRVTDTLSAINASGTNTWTAFLFDPATGAGREINNFGVAVNEIVVFAGGRDLPGGQLAAGATGGSTTINGSLAWIDQVLSRGEPGALTTPPTDFGPWGGSVAFDTLVPWYFGTDTNGLDNTKHDFLTVATHELAHVLGFGIAGSWTELAKTGFFTGAASMAENDLTGPIPLDSSRAHWRSGFTEGGQAVLMDPSIGIGVREQLTRLDMAGLDDMGWEVIPSSLIVSGSHVYGDNGSFPIQITARGSRSGAISTSSVATITNELPVLNPRVATTARVNQLLSIVDLGSFSDLGFDVPGAVPAKTERFTFRVDWGDGSAVDSGSATIDRNGSVGVTTLGSFDGTHVYLNTGNYTVTYTVQDDDGGSAQQQFLVSVQPPPEIQFSVDKTQFAEDAGATAAMLTISRNGFDLSQPLTVALTSNNTSKLSLPASATIPANASQIAVPIAAVDNALMEGTIQVLVTGNAAGAAPAAVVFDVLDRESIRLQLNRTRIGENELGTASMLSVTRTNTNTEQSIVVQLINSDPSEANIASSITILAGSQFATLAVEAVDDSLLDGLQTVLIVGRSSGYADGQSTLEVDDFEPLQLALQPTSLGESVPQRNGTATVQLPGPAPAGVALTVTTSVPDQLIVPTSVPVPTGATSVSFPVSVMDNYMVEGSRSIRLTVFGTGFVLAMVDLTIADDDLPLWQNSINHLDVDNNSILTPLDAILVINRLNKSGSGPLIPGIEPVTSHFYDVNGNGFVEPLDALLIINELNLRR